MTPEEKPGLTAILKELPWIDRAFMLFFIIAGFSLVSYGMYVVGLNGLYILLGVLFFLFFVILYRQTGDDLKAKLKRKKRQIEAPGPEIPPSPANMPDQLPKTSMPDNIPNISMPGSDPQKGVPDNTSGMPPKTDPDNKPKKVQQNLLNDMFKKM